MKTTDVTAHVADADNTTSTKIVNLFHAVEENNEAAAKSFVVGQNVSVSETNYDDETAAHIAAKNGNLNIVKMILARDPSIISYTDAGGDTILFLAIEKGHLHVVKYLVEECKADISQKNHRYFGCTPIHIAAQYGQLAIMKYFVEEKKGDVNIRNKLGETPAFFAAENKHHHIIKYLAEETNADLTLVDSSGQNVLYMPIKKNDLPLLKYLLGERKIKVDVNAQNNLGGTLVHQAAILNRVEILKYLVGEFHADVNIPDNMNVSPLHSAALRNHFETCQYLIEQGANTTMRDYRNMTPVEYASDHHLTKYMNEVEQKRSRRSVSEPLSVLLPHSTMQLNHQRMYPSLSNRHVGEGPFGQFDSSYLQSSLVVAQMIVRVTKNTVERLGFLSPEENVRSRVDPVAIEALYAFH
jgi:ankyrin repeat protein